ncbi:NnrU family protein [Celeribacter litoreus]|uniref:NnrU family protein n=1 Tax=Celeribacter litoreus TaxID=2876714 RepID=UPI001CC9F438|nr:NnrU family protein [Celeribacter litoreus]MCA0043225.1 NnrU family protein [Celeribacter litoreus]
MQGWLGFLIAFIAFFATHAIPVRPPVKARLVALIGARGFSIAYSLLSLAVLIWLLMAAGRAPFVPLWGKPLWINHLVMTLMLPACLLLAFAIGRPNPFSFGGGKSEAYVPEKPGLIRWVRHPLLVVLLIWSSTHVIANGDLAHVLVFGSFAIFSVFGMRMIDRRKRRQMGARHDDLRIATRSAPLFTTQATPSGLIIRGLLGVALYGVLLFAHGPVIGISPLP